MNIVPVHLVPLPYRLLLRSLAETYTGKKLIEITTMISVKL